MEPAASNPLTTLRVLPKTVDPGVDHFLAPNYVVYDPRKPDVPLVIYFPGTGGVPTTAAAMLAVIAYQGYRAIGLEYDDEPGVAQICSENPDDSCSGKVRERRIYGTNVTREIGDRPNEAVVARLSSLLVYLASRDRSWRTYLNGAEPEWRRIVLCGFSQGAGIAGYIAKRSSVSRVILFSGPWDSSITTVAPWLVGISATPRDRWYAAYHEDEPMAPLIARIYSALKVPPNHIVIFRGGARESREKGLSTHASVIRWPGFEEYWKSLFPAVQ
jgi:dienelactone hydrolase